MADDTTSLTSGVKRVPSAEAFPRELWNRRTCALICSYSGPESEGAKALEPIQNELPPPLLDGVAPMPFPDWQAAFDGLLPKGLQWYWKGDFVKELSDEAISAHIEHGSKLPDGLSLVHLYPIDGAVREVPSDATAWSCRDATWSMVIAGIEVKAKYDPDNFFRVNQNIQPR